MSAANWPDATAAIYYGWVHHDQLLMLLAYPKNVQAELTATQQHLLAKLVKEELQDG